MRTILRKLFGASTGGGACLSFFVFALTGLISGIPLAARAQDSVTVGTVTFRDKTADSIVADGVLSFTDLTRANGSTGNNLTNKFQTNSNVGSIVTFFSPRQTLGSGQSWTATFRATETITFDSVRFGGILCYNANWGRVQGNAKRTNFTVTAGRVTSAPVTINWPGGDSVDDTMEALVPMGQTVTLAKGETLTLLADNGNDEIVSFGFSRIDFLGPVVDTTVTMGRPDFTGASFNWNNWSKFTVVPANLYGLPEGTTGDLTLGAISVMWGSDTGSYTGTIADAQHVVLVDAEGNVVAVSEAPDVTPAREDITSTYRFPAGTTLDATSTYTGYFVKDASTVTVGETWAGTAILVRTRVFVAPSAHTDCYVTDNATWLAPIGFAFGSGDVDAMEWTASPWFTADAAADAWAYGKFQVRFQWMWQGERFPWPNDFALNSVTVTFREGDGGPNNANVRRLVLTDSTNTVVALSAPLETPPTANTDETVTFTFSNVHLSPVETYTGYFVGTAAPTLGQENYTSSPLGNVRFQVRSQVANGGCAVGEGDNPASHAPDFTFAVSTFVPEQPLGALNINFDTNADRLADDTLYGIEGVQYPGSQWNDITTCADKYGENAPFEAQDTVGNTVTVTYAARLLGNNNVSNADPLLRQVLTDGAPVVNPWIELEGIPYETYDVYVYMSQHDDGYLNGSVTLNEDESIYYYMEEGQEVASTATTNTSWGANNNTEPNLVFGKNVIRIPEISGPTLRIRGNRRGSNRSNIAAVQIVEVWTEPDPTHWEGTISENAAASTLMVSNGTTQKALSALTEADTVELAFEGTFTLTVDAPVTVNTLTLTGAEGARLITVANGGSLTAAETAIEGGTVMTAEGTFVSESPIDLAEGTTLQIQGADGASFTQAVTGAGAVEIYTGSDVTVEADFTHTGGTTVNGVVEGDTQTTTTLRYAGHAVGSVTVGPGGVFDLNGHACAQSITLNGGTLRADEAINETVVAGAAAVNFHSGQGSVGTDEVGGLLPMRGSYWTNTTGGTGTSAFSFYDSHAVENAGAGVVAEGSVTWSCAEPWNDSTNQTSYLKGYLDDTGNHSLTLTIPESIAAVGYSLYLYSSVDATGGSPFSARRLTGDNGTTTSYTYANGALTTGSTAGWGNPANGRSTVAEGTNVMVIPGLTDRSLTVNFPNESGRGGVAALQILSNASNPGNVAGSLSVTGADSKIEIADGLDISFVGSITVSGEGTLSKVGTGTMTLLGAAVTGDFAITEGVAALNEASVSGTITVNNENGLTLDAASYEGLTVSLPEAASAQSTAESVTIGALTGEGSFDFNGATRLALADAEGAFKGEFLNATDATLAVAGGTFAPTEAQIGQVATLRAEGGTLTLPTTKVPRLEVAGGTVDGQGGASLAAYTEISAGSVTLTAAGTAASARPAAETAGAATVENFTLAEGGTIHYDTPADRDLYFPEGFIPFRGADAQPYVIVLGEDFADFATFPFSFTVLGADTDASFTLQRPDGTAAPEASYTADGSVITIWNVGAIIDYSEELPEARYHYAFNGNLTSTGSEDTALLNENAAYVTSENGQALSAGSPYVTGGDFSFSGAWTLGLYLNVAEAAPQVTLFHAAVQAGFTSPGTLFLTTGETADEIVLWRRNNGDTSFEALLTADLGLGGANAWHHVLITHTDTRIRLYVDGEQVGEFDGTFENTYNGIQIGKGLSNTAVDGHTNGAGTFQLDDVTIWPAALRDVQIEKALATTTAAWRIREGETPAELFTADAPWTRTDGTSDVFAAADEDASTLTARATLSVKAGADELFTALQSFTARYVLLDGEPLSYALTGLTAPTSPANIQTLVVDNDLTVDLSAVNLAMASQIAAEPEGYCILPIRWRGALTLTHIPDGFDFDIEARDDGVYLTFAAGGAGSVRALNINFDTNANRLDAETLYGLESVQYPGSQWNTLTTVSNGSVASGLSVTDTVGNPLTVSYFGKGFETFANSEYNPLLKTVLMDGGGGNAVDPYVQIEGIPYAAYDAYIYMASNYNDGVDYFHNAAVQVNDGDYYTMLADQDAATVVDAPSQGVWAVGQDPRQVALGVTVMRIAGLSDETLKLTTTHRSGGGRGNIAAVQVVAFAPLYTRTVNGTEAWEDTGAWTSVLDGRIVDVPPRGARLMVETTDASILTVDGTLPAYDSLTVVGGGTLALSVDGQNLLTDDEYRAIPRGQAHTVTILDATIDPAQVTAWVSALKYGATATVSATEAGISVDVSLPDAAYENSTETTTQDVGSISFNFTNFRNRDSVGIGDIADDAMGATGTPYETYGAYWLEPTTPSELGQPATETLNAPVVLNSARGAAGADTSKTASLTYNIYHSYANGIAGENQAILAGYANGHSLSGGQGSGGIPSVTVDVPEDWDTYTAVIYMSTDSGSPQWLPKRVNGTFYYYEGTTLTTLADTSQATTVGALPDEVKDTTHAWGAPTQDGSLVEGTNMMVIPGLTGDFKLEWWSKPAASGNNVDISQTQGCVAAFQLIADDAQVPLPNLGTVRVYQATLTGKANWADLQWTINGTDAENAPGAEDLVELTLAGDATLTFDAATTVSSITVYGQGHALRVTDAANATATWHFLNDTILALGEGDVLSETIAVYPKRVRYDYAYEGNYAATAAYETEFAAGFSGNLGQINVGFVEFSGGDVVIGRMTSGSGTATGTLVFSGDVRLTMTDAGNAAGLRIGNTDVIFRDNAAATLSRIHMRGESATHSSITVEDNADITVTGSMNGVSNYNTLQFGDWGGTSALTLRDNARLVAAAADLMLGGSGATADNSATVTLEDDAEMRVAGVARYNESSGKIVLNGGSFLVGSRGFRTYSPTTSSVLSVAFNGGVLGAWQNWKWDGTTAAIVTTVTGDPILETVRGATLTVGAGANLFSTALEATVRGEGTVTSALTTLPSLTLEGGTFATTVAAQASSVSLSGGTLALSGGALRLADGLETHGVGSVRIPVSPSGAAGWLAMADGGLVPNVANVVFTLALNLAGADSLLPYRVPLFMGAYRNNVEPTCGFAYSGNVNNAVSSATPIYAKGNQGQGLYAQLAGNSVVQPHTQALNATNPGNISQATASVYDYWIFKAETVGGKLTVADGGVGIKDVSFEGLSAVIIASGATPHPLLQTETLSLGIPVTFDLSAWADALNDWAAGAVNGVPASLCLASGQVSVETTPTFIGWEAPAGVIVSIKQGERGLYLVATSDRLAGTVSVNFSTRANPLSSTPAAPGAYAVPVSAWNDLRGLFSSALLYVSDIGGAATVQATRGEGEAAQPTQVSSTSTAIVTGATPSLLQAWLSDAAATTLRVANVPFARYRLALIFSNDLGDAAFSTVTVGSDVYAMDAAGYVRKNVIGLGKVAGDTQWGSTTIDTENYFRQGNNVLLTDVITTPSVSVSLPAAVYGRTYAGVAAVQVIEAPDTATSEEGADYAYDFAAATDDADGDGLVEANLADLGLTVDGTAGQTWQSGPNNTLALTVPQGLDVTLTLPLNFQADTISATGEGSLTLQVEENGGAALSTLNAANLGNLTVHFPCVGVAFTPADGVTRFEAAFNNNGEAYTIAEGATLALGENSGIAVSLNGTTDRSDGTTTLIVASASTGTLRRDYAEAFSVDWSDTSYRNQTWSFRSLTNSANRDHLVFSPDLLIEEGDVWSLSGSSVWLQSGSGHKTNARLTQTGGSVELGASYGFLIASNDNTALALDFDLSGGRFASRQLVGWGNGTTLDLDVTGTGVLALGNGAGSYIGALAARVANVTMNLDFTEGGTFEPLADTIGRTANGTYTVTFGDNANLAFGADTPAEVNMTLPVTFAGSASAPTTIDPGKYGTLVLNAANTGSGAITVPHGTVALANANGLGNATATIASGAAFESRGFTGEHEGAEEARAIPVIAIKIDFPAGVGETGSGGGYDGTAIQEFCLYEGGTWIRWPEGTTISGTGDRGTATWTPQGNGQINALIDRVVGTATAPGTGINPNGENVTYDEATSNNKWFMTDGATAANTATILLGDGGAVFDSYSFFNSDRATRFPSGWTISVRYEGDAADSWTVLDTQANQERPAANVESQHYAVTLRTTGGATTLDDVTGRVVFQAGAQCRAVRKAGAPGLPYVARIAGSITVADGTRFFLDGEEFAAAHVTVNAAQGLVTFGAGGPITVTDVIWDVMNPTGTWADGSTGPWVDGATFRNGAGVSFPAPTGDTKIEVSVLGAPRPGAAFSVEGDLDYTFSETEPGDRIDLSAAEVNEYPSVDAEEDANDITVRAIELGAATYDVPINTGAADRGISANGSTIRLFGDLSADGKTATLLGDGNINVTGTSPHGVWFDGSENPVYLTLSPHAGETQTLSAYAAHLRGSGTVTIAGQVADDGSVSGGTVEFGGTSSTGGNNAFTGAFVVRDGATLDFTMTHADSGNNPFFRASDGTPLYKNGLVGFTLRNGGTLRFSGHRGFIAGWGQMSNATNYASLWTSQPIAIGYRSSLEFVYGSGTDWQHTPYGLRFDGDGATLTIDDGDASGLGVAFVRGATLTVAGVGDAGDPDDPKTTDGKLTQGITATIQTVEGATMRIFGDGGQNNALFLDVHEGSTLRVAADLGSTTPDGINQTDPAPFVKRGPGRMTIEWPEIANLVEVEVEEGTLGGTAALTDSASTITVAAGATIEAGLSVPTLTVEDGATLAIDPTGALQLRADTALFDNRGTYLVTALTEPAEATGREPIKVVSWANAPESVNAAFQADDALATAGYGLEVRTDGLYLMPAVTYYRELSGIGSADSYQLLWDDPAWYTSLADVGQADKAGAFNPTEGVTVNVVFLLPTSSAIDQLRDIVIGLSGPTVFSSLCVASRGSDDTLTVLDPNITYTYELRNETPPAKGEVKVFEWLSSLVYTTGTRTEVARLQATVPDNTAYTVDGTSVILYRVAEGRAAINVSFAAGTEGTPSWLPAETAPCGPVPYAGVYWNNITATTGTPLNTVTGATHAARQTSLTVTGRVDDQNNPETATLTYAYRTANGFGSVNNRALNGDARLAAGFLCGANTAFTAIGDLEAPGVNAGWTVRVSDIPFASYDLYLLFAGSADGAVNYPAVRVKVGNEAWRTYAFVNGWTSPAGDAAWSGQGYSDQGFVDGLNLLHLRIEGAEGGAIQIAPCDSAATTAVGLAGLQIVELDANDPVYYRFAGTRWGDGSSWLLSGDNTRGAWADATLKAPHHARFDNTITALEVDREVVVPFLRFDGVSNLTVTGEPGFLSTGGLDFTDVTTAGTVTFEEDVFAKPPEVVLGSALTLELPEPASGTLDNDWRWRYSDDAAHGATLRKTKAGDLRLTQTIDQNLQIDNGTLWLTDVSSNASTNYPYAVGGEGTLGWAGADTLRIAFNNLPAGNNDPENAFLRVSSGTVTMAAAANNSLPAERTILIENGGTVEFSYSSPEDGNTRPLFTNGRFLIRNGGRLRYNATNASNLFRNTNATNCLQVPTVELQSGQFQQNLTGSDNNGTVHDVLTITSDGLSRHHIIHDNANCWASRALNVRNGQILVNSGKLALTFGGGNNASRNSIHLMSTAEVAASHGDADETCGYINVANGATFYSGYPIVATNTDWATNDATLVKIGGGVWVQAHNICQSVGYHFVTGQGQDGGNSPGGNQPYCNVEVRAGTLRLNGSRTFAQPTSGYMAGGAVQDRTVTIQNNARLDGAGDFDQYFNVTIAQGGTVSAGFPADVEWATADEGWNTAWYQEFPDRFTEPDDEVSTLTFNGDLIFENGAILEVNLGGNARVTTPAATEESTSATVRFEGTLNVRLTNMPLSIAEPVRLTNFGTTPTGLIESAIVCPEAIAIDAKVRLCTEAEATGEEGADDTINNIWLIPSGASHIWTEATGAWSESKWTVGTQANQPIRNGNNTESSSERPDPSNPDKSPTARVESANGVTLTIDKPTEPTMANPNATDALNYWGTYGLILSGAGDITLAQGGALTAGNPPTGALYGVDVGTSFWKLGTGNATVDSILRLYGTGSTFTVSGGTLTLKRPILQAVNLASQDQQGVQLLNPFEIGSGATLTLDFALPEDETKAATLRSYYDDVLGIDIPIGMSDDVLVAQAQSLAGSLTGSGTLRVQGEGTTVRIGSDDSSESIADSGVNFSVGTGATLFLTANLTGSGAATRTAAVEPGAILDLQAERALGSADWTLNLAAGADDEDTTTPDGALVRSDRDIRLRGTVAVTGTGTATLGADLSVDDSLAVEVPAGAVLTLSGSTIGTPEDAAEDAVFTKRGAGVLDVTSGNFELGLPVSVEAGTLRLTGSLPSTIRPSDDRTIDWTVGPGGTLAFNGATRFDLDVYGDLTVEAGGTLALTGSSGVSILGDPLLAAGSTVSFGNGEALPNATDSGVLTFFNGVTVDGTVTVVINALPARLPQSGVTLISFGDGTGNRHGNGTFVLGGDTAADIAAAGYTLRDNGASVTLEPFGGDLLYTWAATGDDPASSTDWTGTNWVIRNGDELVAWPETTATTPAVIFPERSPLAGEATIPTAFRTINWAGNEAQTLAGLQASNEAANADGTAGGDYTLTGTSTLTIDGSLLKTGSGGLTFNRPVSVSSSGALSLFGGTVTFANAASLTGASVDLNDATLAFTGDTDVTVSGRLAGNGNGVVRKAGAGVLTVSTTIGETIDRFDVDGGTLRLTANAQADVLTPTFDMAAGTTLALRGSVVGGATIEPTFAEGNTGFTLLWEGSAPTSTAASPVLGTVPATTFEYRPASGHLILDPESLPEGAALVLGDDITETNALRLGVGQGGTAIRLGALTAPRGAVIGVEPTVDLAAGDWATERALTLALTANATCGATFMGAPLSDGTVVRAGLTVEKAAGAAADPILTYIGESDHDALGTLTAGNGARVEVTGTWAGPAAALSGGTLAGNGVIGAAGTTSGNVEVALGGILSASVTSSATGLVTPDTLTVQGDLAIHDGARLDVSAAVQADGTTAVSHVVTDSVTFVENRVNIDVYLDSPADAAVNGKPILSWSSFNGTTAVTGTVKVYNEATGNWDESNDYSVIQEGNSLVLRRASNRFWMILR